MDIHIRCVSNGVPDNKGMLRVNVVVPKSNPLEGLNNRDRGPGTGPTEATPQSMVAQMMMNHKIRFDRL